MSETLFETPRTEPSPHGFYAYPEALCDMECPRCYARWEAPYELALRDDTGLYSFVYFARLLRHGDERCWRCSAIGLCEYWPTLEAA